VPAWSTDEPAFAIADHQNVAGSLLAVWTTNVIFHVDTLSYFSFSIRFSSTSNARRTFSFRRLPLATREM